MLQLCLFRVLQVTMGKTPDNRRILSNVETIRSRFLRRRLLAYIFFDE